MSNTLSSIPKNIAAQIRAVERAQQEYQRAERIREQMEERVEAELKRLLELQDEVRESFEQYQETLPPIGSSPEEFRSQFEKFMGVQSNARLDTIGNEGVFGASDGLQAPGAKHGARGQHVPNILSSPGGASVKTDGGISASAPPVGRGRVTPGANKPRSIAPDDATPLNGMLPVPRTDQPTSGTKSDAEYFQTVVPSDHPGTQLYVSGRYITRKGGNNKSYEYRLDKGHSSAISIGDTVRAPVHPKGWHTVDFHARGNVDAGHELNFVIDSIYKRKRFYPYHDDIPDT